MSMSGTKTYGVFLHSSGEQGGFVVRTMYDGWTPAPYSTAKPVHSGYRSEKLAQLMADKLNLDRFGAAA
jgi:hypothetical protein